MSDALLWPTYDAPEDLASVEAVPLADRGLPATSYEALSRAAELWPDRPAVSVMPEAARWREYTQRTFGRLRDDVVRAANVLHQLGVRRGDVVGLMSPNCNELITATLCAELAGIAGPVNPGLDACHVEELLRRSGARVLIVAGPELDKAVWDRGVALAEAGVLDALIALRPTDATEAAPKLPEIPGIVVDHLASLMEHAASTAFVGDLPQADDLAAVFHTGGTTGIPKLAAHTHTNQVVDAWLIAANLEPDEDSSVLGALPLFHVNALMVTVIAPMLRGQHVVWAGPLGYRDFSLYGEIWKIVEHFRVATMSAVPTVYQVLSGCPVDADISSMRFAVVGASALPPAVRESFESATGIPLLEGYGLTEATCASARSFVEARRPGSVGQRMAYQQAKAVRIDADGTWHDLPAGEVGTLAISGPTVFAGYVTGRDAHGPITDGLGKVVDGWLDTGDLASVDTEGFIRLTGRAKDLIIRGGHNIEPGVVEDAILSHPGVTGAGAVGRPDLHAGEVPVVFVTLVPGAVVTGEELVAWAAARVPEAAAAPKDVIVLDALPLTDVGKPNKLPLRAHAAREAITADLQNLVAPHQVDAVVEDGSVVVVVQLEHDDDRAAVEQRIGNYAISWRISEPEGQPS